MQHTIVIADDEAHITHVVALKVKNAGYEAIIAHDGEEALELCLEHQPSLVITDLQMPYMTGLELAQKLKLDERTADTPVLMLTARGYALDKDELAQTNIRQILDKPFSPREVIGLVSTLLGDTGTEERAAA
ncbi:MAG: response regulator [Planctomycetota bacterium]